MELRGRSRGSKSCESASVGRPSPGYSEVSGRSVSATSCSASERRSREEGSGRLQVNSRWLCYTTRTCPRVDRGHMKRVRGGYCTPRATTNSCCYIRLTRANNVSGKVARWQIYEIEGRDSKETIEPADLVEVIASFRRNEHSFCVDFRGSELHHGPVLVDRSRWWRCWQALILRPDFVSRSYRPMIVMICRCL